MTQMEGYVSQNDHGITVVLDTNLTPELIEEGYVREILSKIQTMRKEAGFEVMDRINIYVDKNEEIIRILEKNKKEIMSEVLANDVIFGKMDGYTKQWNVNGKDVELGVKKQ
jgi:isoleucyl-tRNA synthetase